MKKNYFLTLLFALCVSVFSFGQVILSESFSYADGSLVGNGGWAREGGTAGDFQVTSGQAVVQHGAPSEDVKLAFSSVEGDVYVAFDFSVDDLGAPYSGSDNEYFAHLDFKARMDIVPPSGSGDFSVGISSTTSSAQATWDSDLTFGTTYRAVIKFDQTTSTAQLWINPTSSTDTSISGNSGSSFTVGEFELRQSDSSENETVRVDNLMIGETFSDVLTFEEPSTPALSIGGVTDNQEFSPETTDVSVTLSVNNFTLSADDGSGNSDGSGDGYIKSTLAETGQPLQEESFFTTTLEDIAVVSGNEYTLTMELVDNSGNSLSPAVSASATWTVASYTQVANIAALRSGTEGEYYELTGEAIMTFDAGNSRNQKYIEDSSAAVLIDDNDDIITTSYNVGDGITGIKGKLGSYAGVLQFVPQVDPGAASSSGNTITAQVVTISDLTTNFEDYESEWITINDVTFTDADGSATFASGQNYDISDGVNTLVFRTQFSNADFIGTVIPTSSANITGPAAEFNGTAQIFGTSSANIVLGVQSNEIEGFAAYPNPVLGNNFTITTNSTDNKNVQLFNVLGKKIFTASFSGTRKTLDISNIASGIYILKVIEGTRIATQKLIIE